MLPFIMPFFVSSLLENHHHPDEHFFNTLHLCKVVHICCRLSGYTPPSHVVTSTSPHTYKRKGNKVAKKNMSKFVTKVILRGHVFQRIVIIVFYKHDTHSDSFWNRLLTMYTKGRNMFMSNRKSLTFFVVFMERVIIHIMWGSCFNFW